MSRGLCREAMSPMSPISPSAMSPMSPNPMSPMSHNPLSPTALSPMSPVEFYPGSPTHMRNYHRRGVGVRCETMACNALLARRSNSGASASDVPTSPVNTNSRSSKALLWVLKCKQRACRVQGSLDKAPKPPLRARSPSCRSSCRAARTDPEMLTS